MSEYTRVALLVVLVLVTGIDMHDDKKWTHPQAYTQWNSSMSLDLRIVGGKPASPGQFPHQVLITSVRSDGNYYDCGGSLISTRYVLSAAHCFQDFYSFRVVLGSLQLKEITAPDEVAFSLLPGAVIKHPEYDASVQKNDIVLIELPRAVELSKNQVVTPKTERHKSNNQMSVSCLCLGVIRPIRLPSRTQAKDNSIFDDEVATISGYGKTSNDADSELILMYAHASVYGYDACSKDFLIEGSYVISDTQICTCASNGPGACQGDSGGPVTVLEEDGLPTQIGIMSLVIAGCPLSSPTAHTRVSSYLDFIENNSDVEIRN